MHTQKSRYVNNLLSTAKMRDKEKERVYEKKLLKERTEEDKEFGDKPKFMTSAYKKKLLEDQKWEYEDRCVLPSAE
jgi:coiled-coil domain-containing protein 55